MLDREELSKELYKKRKLQSSQQRLLAVRVTQEVDLTIRVEETIHQRKYNSSLQRKLQSSQQRLLAVRATQEVDLTIGVEESILQRKLAVRVLPEEEVRLMTISC